MRIEEVEIVPLDEQLARSCGELCGATNTSDIIETSDYSRVIGGFMAFVADNPPQLKRGTGASRMKS